ncbi:MAG: hypothetical protein GWM90_20060 [Gemmatimonadetes bacterium]|nr:hypothetical protein [Gemmatimonadota bacterium]NIQ56737.1 hypothetical protein [Gemmatimonadota bacterium]NIR38878.1 hypothetical protein [Actinomycetota bacterium]NIU76924.1 hypothetical protein [Gammaproteobacteria bacterium]NIX46295.1 hypothetical protein [Gemmatimonadota bacterium]
MPRGLAEALREATEDQDLDRLHDLIDGVAEHDAEVAEYLRRLVSDVAFDALEEFFDVHGR